MSPEAEKAAQDEALRPLGDIRKGLMQAARVGDTIGCRIFARALDIARSRTA